MAYSCCSGNFSSRSFRRCLPSSGSSCSSSYPSNLVYTTTSCSPSPCQVESSLNTGCQETCIEPTNCQRSYVVSRPCQVDSSANTGCQETCIEPTSCQRSCVVSRPCQTACYYPRSSTPCSPCQGTYAGSLSFYSGGCGSRGFRSLNCGVSEFPSLSYGSRFCYPLYLPSAAFQPYCYTSACGSGSFGCNC
ncbi:keratin-associated protein 13-1-like [Chionomys nivalis]|uniref:keratin-associated protein 13-1-like n=1 Tax=Chionomys nivalis TaxID=269649 RepID=UPI0025927F83|nr:keratin-associated protein 13-1-like [Chionomys nivalis]